MKMDVTYHPAQDRIRLCLRFDAQSTDWWLTRRITLRLLQALLGLAVPRWHHHSLLLDESGGKLAKRKGDLETHLEEQFTSGRLLACITSRPGQSGRADGYILEGKELEFYQKQLAKKKKGQK